MRLTGSPIILFGLVVFVIQMIETHANDRKQQCQALVTGAISVAAGVPCIAAAGPFAYVCAIAVPIASGYATNTCGRRKRAA